LILVLVEKKTLSPTPLSLSKNIYDEIEVKTEAVEVKDQPKTNCITCGSDCTDIHYHSKTNEDVCQTCYKDGRFPNAKGVYVRVGPEDNKWTEQEKLLLLEGVELYQEDWSKVSSHVGKPRDECLLTFLQLPIDDSLGLSSQDLSNFKASNKVPFSPADNPVLTLAAYLASIVNPEVAKKSGDI
jgi:SWI/SNF related-matrix-associated actin-dependent regulator of chromatin subfamily C